MIGLFGKNVTHLLIVPIQTSFPRRILFIYFLFSVWSNSTTVRSDEITIHKSLVHSPIDSEIIQWQRLDHTPTCAFSGSDTKWNFCFPPTWASTKAPRAARLNRLLTIRYHVTVKQRLARSGPEINRRRDTAELIIVVCKYLKVACVNRLHLNNLAMLISFENDVYKRLCRAWHSWGIRYINAREARVALTLTLAC